MKRPADENNGLLPDCESCGLAENMHDGNGKVIGLDGGHVCEEYISEGYDEDDDERLPVLSKECDAVDCANCSDVEANCCECPCHHAPKTQHVVNETIDITPHGCQTTEGTARCEAAVEAWRSWDAHIINHLSELLVGTEVESLTAEDVYVLRGLLVTRYAKQEAFVRAVAGR